MTDDLRREIERRMREAFLHCTQMGSRWISRSQAYD